MRQLFWSLVAASACLLAAGVKAEEAPAEKAAVAEQPATASTPAEQVARPAATQATEPDEQRPAEAAKPQDDRWRFKFQNGHWWYWLPSEKWVFWWNNQWVEYDPQIYAAYWQSTQPQQYVSTDYGSSSGGGYYYPDYGYRSYGGYGGYGYRSSPSLGYYYYRHGNYGRGRGSHSHSGFYINSGSGIGFSFGR